MKTSVLSTVLCASLSSAHTIIRSVYVNGVDQGTGVGIREPAFNGPPPSGYQNGPIKDLTSPDMTCNILGDIPDPNTIPVEPGDVITFEWGHNNRLPTDDVIADSHKGPISIYLAPNPPTGNAWVKIFEEGEYEPGEWAIVPKLIDNDGHVSIVVPEGLQPGDYLVRNELLALHEADVSHIANPIRGAQFYIDCVQISVGGNGTVALPEGVAFPGAYDYDTPGIVYNIYTTTAGEAPYTIPGPTVWTGAAPSPTNMVGDKIGVLSAPTSWNTWVGADRTVTVVAAPGETERSAYVPSWPVAGE